MWADQCIQLAPQGLLYQCPGLPLDPFEPCFGSNIGLAGHQPAITAITKIVCECVFLKDHSFGNLKLARFFEISI